MNRRSFLVLSALFLTPPLAHAQDATWKAGVAKAVITPKQPTWMSGYASRTKPAEGKVHDLWAKALVLEDAAGKRCLLVTLDLVGIDRDTAQAVCRDIEERYHVPRAAVRLAVSHTHCGPVVGSNLRSMYQLPPEQEARIDEFTVDLKKTIVAVAGEALKALAPARVEHGNGHVTFATNRRNNKEPDVPKLRAAGMLKGPVDHNVPVLAVRDPDGRVRAVVFGYACHATVLGFYQWCGDYPGFAQLALEKEYPGAVALFWAGCGADQNPLPRRTVALAESYGGRLAAGVADVLGAPMTPVEPMLRTAYAEVPLALADLPSRETLVEQAAGKERYVAARAKMLLHRLESAGSLRQTYPYPVQTWQLGRDLTWTALGGEVVVDYSLRLKRELTGHANDVLKRDVGPLWVTGYANDVMAYIPSLRVLMEGGYEGASSMVYYGLPTVWSPRVEETIVEAVRQQVDQVRSAKR
jgi:hypothetical protein